MGRGVEEELEERQAGEGDGEELLSYLLGRQGKRVIEESVGRERRGQSTEDGGEGKDTVEDGMDEIGGGKESAHVKEEQEGEVVMEEKEGGEEEELQAGAEENTPDEKHHQSELPFM